MNSVFRYFKKLLKRKSDGLEAPFSGTTDADSLLNAMIAEERLPGLAITVINRGKVFFQKGYGFADLEKKIPVDAQKTIFRIASISKNIAATALAHIVKEGLIDLDASLYDYVPYFPKKKYDFTIRQLANHTAGLRAYKGMEYGLDKPYTIKESLKIFADDELVFEPGTDYLYNSFGWVLISLAIQEVSGMPFAEYVKQKVLEPLGMERTFAPDRLQVGNTEDSRTPFYSKTRKGFKKAMKVNNFYKLAGGGYLSTSDDIAKFGLAHLNKTVLENEIMSQFFTSGKINGTQTYYGLGWQVSEDTKGRPFYGHVGNAVGGYSNLFVYPGEQMVFSILTNCTNPKIQHIWDKVVDIFIRRNTET